MTIHNCPAPKVVEEEEKEEEDPIHKSKNQVSKILLVVLFVLPGDEGIFAIRLGETTTIEGRLFPGGDSVGS